MIVIMPAEDADRTGDPRQVVGQHHAATVPRAQMGSVPRRPFGLRVAQRSCRAPRQTVFSFGDHLPTSLFEPQDRAVVGCFVAPACQRVARAGRMFLAPAWARRRADF